MSVNKKSVSALKKAAPYAFSVFCGALVSGLALALFSVAMYILGLPPEIAGALAFVAFAAGCFSAGFICGRIKQRGGLRCGFVCAAAMSAAVLAGSVFTGGLSGADAVSKLVCALAASCSIR